MMLRLVLFVLLIGFVSGVEVDLDCDEDIFVGEEFECEIEVSDGEARYDLKVEVDEERDSVLRIFCEERGWISGYYYLTDFVRDDEVVVLKIEEAGRYDVVLKLRDGDWRKEFDVGKLKVREREVEEGVLEELEEENIGTQINADNADFEERNAGIISLGREDEIISLGDEAIDEVLYGHDSGEPEWDYVSKDGMVVDWLPYAFCLFLIGLIGALVWDRLWDRRI